MALAHDPLEYHLSKSITLFYFRRSCILQLKKGYSLRGILCLLGFSGGFDIALLGGGAAAASAATATVEKEGILRK